MRHQQSRNNSRGARASHRREHGSSHPRMTGAGCCCAASCSAHVLWASVPISEWSTPTGRRRYNGPEFGARLKKFLDPGFEPTQQKNPCQSPCYLQCLRCLRDTFVSSRLRGCDVAIPLNPSRRSALSPVQAPSQAPRRACRHRDHRPGRDSACRRPVLRPRPRAL